MKCKTTAITLLVLLTALCVLSLGIGFGTMGCTGQKARDTVGVQALGLALTGVLADAEHGVTRIPAGDRPAAYTQLFAYKAAVESKDRRRVVGEAVAAWPTVKSMALTGIAARLSSQEIGAGVAESLRERVKQTEIVLYKVAVE